VNIYADVIDAANTSLLTTSSINEGNAGNLTVRSQRIAVRSLASLSSSGSAFGDSGSLDIEALESISVSGSELIFVDGEFLEVSSQIASSATEFFSIFPGLQELLGIPDTPLGDGGDLNLRTPDLQISDGGTVTVGNEGFVGSAGTLVIATDTISLDSGSSISAATLSGQGGDIVLSVTNTLTLLDGAEIAASSQGSGDGGNVLIDASLVVAFPQEDSDISASAEFGDGGNVSITTEGIFGLSLRDEDTALSDILVTSELGIDGELIVESPEIDPQSSLVVLPENLVDTTSLIATGCAADNADFALAGRGGLPADPTAPLQAQSLWQDLREPNTTAASEKHPQPRGGSITPNAPQRLIEASGWLVDDNGQVVLLASAEDLPLQQPHCQNLHAANVAR
ncbi:MAG: S-layer family protein, partial [Cyanobacteria bacterium J06641_5]